MLINVKNFVYTYLLNVVFVVILPLLLLQEMHTVLIFLGWIPIYSVLESVLDRSNNKTFKLDSAFVKSYVFNVLFNMAIYAMVFWLIDMGIVGALMFLVIISAVETFIDSLIVK